MIKYLLHTYKWTLENLQGVPIESAEPVTALRRFVVSSIGSARLLSMFDHDNNTRELQPHAISFLDITSQT